MATQFEQRAASEAPASPEVQQPRETQQAPVTPPERPRVTGPMLGGIAACLAAGTILIGLATSRARQRASDRRRRMLVYVQPRLVISAPTIMVSLPFSGITGPMAPGRMRGGRMRGGRIRLRRGGQLLRLVRAQQRRGRGRMR